MPWRIAFEPALAEWEDREHPAPDDIISVKRWVFDVATGRIDWLRTSVGYPGEPELYETRVHGTDVFIEFGVLDEEGIIAVERIESGSRPTARDRT